ncbi:hypothetical protein B0G76_5444 [Paraburkholderia sp. BL23I1N1]|uniref:hypothetical protein n=1 Tax=Paraburkholderia sp. BL23I1N1 TaxID=1938802 RepID=UPI000E72D5EB|nr:hypothetical protein [Paraburkholderia sp. BL23I1N1]RKE25896.1 hypothetical protein B0G76_7465 [Paraburkholderia sp. BL23I1N1]RKE26158.1 hypothetical protein B0G76_7766 [Paraburkholderia sp. BL23I1N1]RKE36377.1 hypothetical protein B0G76_2553 [Paraburkholderia sp. BL23I1N1]RKE38697.1 hypothetical protein B0G76_5039 [Paraburkholderia sp. BL23I1N1]RKE39059.1 hypothetical protein B0G76_5444 [Paraburkholderia sp. BL23I1N1]
MTGFRNTHFLQSQASPGATELNLIEILWKHAKYHWRGFVTWTKETIDAEVKKLLDGFGSDFQIRFS